MHRETTPKCLQQGGDAARRTATLSSPNERRAGSVTTPKLDEERRRMSALTRIADSSRTLRHVRKVPTSDSCTAAIGRTIRSPRRPGGDQISAYYNCNAKVHFGNKLVA